MAARSQRVRELRAVVQQAAVPRRLEDGDPHPAAIIATPPASHGAAPRGGASLRAPCGRDQPARPRTPEPSATVSSPGSAVAKRSL